MRRLFIAAGSAIAWLFAAGQAPAAVGASDPHALEVARELAAGRLAMWSKVEPAVELMLRREVAQALDATETAKSDKIAAVVHASLQAVGDDLVEARATALAATYSSSELDGLLAFRRSNIGEAFSQATPEFSREIAAALKSGAPLAEEPPPSPQKLELIHRV